MTIGVDAAVVLASFGLPVAPFIWAMAASLGWRATMWTKCTSCSAGTKGAMVRYSSATALFYLTLTDCVRTLLRRVRSDPRLSQVKMLFDRHAASVPGDPDESFVNGMAIIERRHGDRISSAGLLDPNLEAVSILLCAGWEIDGVAYGASNGGYFAVPMQLLRALLTDPALGAALFFSVDADTAPEH